MFYHIRHFTLLCLPKGCLLRSNRLSLKKSLEKATEELRRLWKGQLWREKAFSAEVLSTRRAGAEQAQSTAADQKGCALSADPFFETMQPDGLSRHSMHQLGMCIKFRDDAHGAVPRSPMC